MTATPAVALPRGSGCSTVDLLSLPPAAAAAAAYQCCVLLLVPSLALLERCPPHAQNNNELKLISFFVGNIKKLLKLLYLCTHNKLKGRGEAALCEVLLMARPIRHYSHSLAACDPSNLLIKPIYTRAAQQ